MEPRAYDITAGLQLHDKVLKYYKKINVLIFV
jgi:hypothetical protein